MSKDTNYKLELNQEYFKFKRLLGRTIVGEFELQTKEDIISILSTTPVQVLNDRKQLGLLYKIGYQPWKNANHTRLQHTIGVVAKCVICADVLNENTVDPALHLTLTDVRELIVAV